jgi:hypothetical protein
MALDLEFWNISFFQKEKRLNSQNQGCAQLNVFQYVEWIDDQRQLNVNQHRIRIT